jgi:general secretion pathway protein G
LQIAHPKSQTGFTLFELIITLTVLSVLVMGTIPLTQNAVKRNKELRLRETLRLVRQAIDEFKRDTVGACTGNPTIGGGNRGSVPSDPRSRAVIEDCEIFDTLNIDRYPPTLDVLVDGVKVRDRGISITAGSGLDSNTKQATELNATDQLTKVYLRQKPIDPMTGESDWKLRSSYQEGDSDSWDDINVFDIRSASDEIALNGEKYSDW